MYFYENYNYYNKITPFMGPVILLFFILRIIYIKWRSLGFSNKNKVSLVGKTVIVTGSNSGIGYETALECAKRGARVIVACKDETNSFEAVETIIKETENKNVVLKLLDLASLKSVRAFAKDILENETRLDILINNAAGLMHGDIISEDGFQLEMQINYFSPVLLTLSLLGKQQINHGRNPELWMELIFDSHTSQTLIKKNVIPVLILDNVELNSSPQYERDIGMFFINKINFVQKPIDLIKKSSPSRIINVSSIVAKFASITPETINSYKSHMNVYANSKLGNILFTQELAKQVKNKNISVFSLHPGLINTTIAIQHFNPLLQFISKYFQRAFFKCPAEGAQTTLFTALEQGIEHLTGSHFEECKVIEPYKTARDPLLSKQIWDVTLKLLKYDENKII